MGLRESLAEMKPKWLGRHEEVREACQEGTDMGTKLKDMK